jgi:CheY-like chemotaxis protein
MKLLVLYFDDEVVLLDIFCEMFFDEYEVRTSSALSEAERIFSECAPDIISSDWKMPEITGIDFSRRAA